MRKVKLTKGEIARLNLLAKEARAGEEPVTLAKRFNEQQAIRELPIYEIEKIAQEIARLSGRIGD